MDSGFVASLRPGMTAWRKAWNRDHTLRSAIAASAVPVYQEIARRIGAERMQKYLDLFEYGNRNIGADRMSLSQACLAAIGAI
jgi:beta-lactamase class D